MPLVCFTADPSLRPWFPFSREPDRKQIFVNTEMKQIPCKYQQNRVCARNRRRPWFGCRVPIDRPIDQLSASDFAVSKLRASVRTSAIVHVQCLHHQLPGLPWRLPQLGLGLWLGFLCRRHGTAQHGSRGLGRSCSAWRQINLALVSLSLSLAFLWVLQ
jgi:hypothetical protein